MAERNWLPPEQWYASLAVLYATAGGFITDAQGRVLMVKANYRPYWSIPGGFVDADEAPHDGCAREIAEELGLHPKVGPLLVIDWEPSEGDRPHPVVHFLFDCGVLDDEPRIHLQHDELDDYAFLPPQEGAALMNPALARRLPAALRARQSGQPQYLPAMTHAINQGPRSDTLDHS